MTNFDFCRLETLYFFLDIDNKFTREKSYILSYINKLPPLFSADELTALQIIPGPPVVNVDKELEDAVSNAKSAITKCILKEHERKGSYEKISRINIIVNMIDANVKNMADHFACFVMDNFKKDTNTNTIGDSYSIAASIALRSMPFYLRKRIKKDRPKTDNHFTEEKNIELRSEFCRRVIFYFFYSAVICDSYNDSERKAIWDLSNRWNIKTADISDMEETAPIIQEILKQKKAIITSKDIAYKEAKPIVENLDAKLAVELAKIRKLLFGGEPKT